MRIAAIYWRTTSVGGINSVLVYYRDAAKRAGDQFDVLISDTVKRPPVRFDKPQIIRGGDTYIQIEGEAPHHPSRIKETLAFLEQNYDAVFFPSIVPHSNERYGFEPLFLPLFTELMLPKVASISDGYWHTYAEWGRLAAPHLRAIFTACPAYAAPLAAEGYTIKCSKEPFYPRQDIETVPRDKHSLTVWVSQWKMIKGIHQLLPVIPQIPGNVELYSCGIQYYQQRTTDEWKAAIGEDRFQGFNGNGKAKYFGWVPLAETMKVLMRSWFMINLQGITAKPARPTLFGTKETGAKNIYSHGSYNNTEREALYYGSLPVLHDQVRNSDIPTDLYLTVSRAGEIPALIGSLASVATVFSKKRIKHAREWVMDNHGADSVFKKLKESF